MSNSQGIQTSLGTIGEVTHEELYEILPRKIEKGPIINFSDGAKDIPIDFFTMNIEPVQSGSGDPSPDNVRPISGFSSVNVNRTGKNLLELTLDDISSTQKATNTAGNGTVTCTATGTYGRAKYHKRVIAGQKYTFSLKGSSTGDYNRVWISPKDDWSIPNAYASGALSTNTSRAWTFTATSEDLYIVFYVTTNATSGVMSVSNIQLELGSTATSYEAYSGSTYPFTFPTPPGTVYGGTLNVTTGVLTVDKVMLTFSGGATSEGIYGDDDAPLYKLEIPNYSTVKIARAQSTQSSGRLSSNYFTFISASSAAKMKNAEIRTQAANTPQYLYFRWDEAADVSAINTAFSTTNLQVLADLQTPQTYQLSPTEVQTLLGENHIWADAGEVTVKYRADIQYFLQKLIKPSGSNMIVTENIDPNKYFIIGNTLYLSTTSIASGATIIPGTNCIKKSLAEALNALKTQED